jgi:hypothetical protein
MSKPFSSLDAINHLSDRELATAILLMVCGLAEKLTCHVPCLITPNEDAPPSLIHGGDARIAWLPTTDRENSQPPELSQAPSHRPPATPLPNVRE